MNSTSFAEMALSLNDARPAEQDLAAWLIERLEVEAGQPSERSSVRRALAEALVAVPGEPKERWWRWIVEAGENLELHCRPIDCTLSELWEVAGEGGRLIIRVPTTGEWVGVSAVRGNKVLVLRQQCDPEQRWVTREQLRQILAIDDEVRPTRCVIIEPQLSGRLSADHHEEHLSPVARAWALLRPEWGDIQIVLVFAVVSGLLALATPLAVEALVTTVTFGRLLQPVVILSLMLFGVLAFQAAVRGLQTFVVEIIQRRLFARVAGDVAYRLPRAQAQALEGRSARELVNRFFDVVTVQKVTAQLLLDAVTLAVNAAVGLAVLGFYHPWLLGFDIVLMVMIAIIIFVMGRGAIGASIEESRMKYAVAAWLEDLAGCPIAFRYDGGAQFALERTDSLLHDYLDARAQHFRILFRQILFALGLQAVASTVLLGLGGWLVIVGQLTLGQLVAAELIVTVIVGSFAKLGKHLEAFYDMMAAVDKLGYLFDLPMEKREGMLLLQTEQPAEFAITELTYLKPDGQPLLDNFSLFCASGERLVLSGPSGSGKSVLIDLLFGLRTPRGGHVQIDGEDPRELRPDILRRSVSLVRDVEIFEGSIAQNIHLERPEVSLAQVRTAVADVGLLSDVLALPEGLETPTNSSGFPLTGLQQRRLMLARAIAGRPTLLLVDGLLDVFPDAEAAELMQRLCDRSQPWTLVVVTGRRNLEKYATRKVELSKTGLTAISAPVAGGGTGDE